MLAFRRVGRMIPSSGSFARITSQSYRSQSSNASIARRMGAESIGQTATIWARSAARLAASATAPEFAAPSAKSREFPAFSRGVPVLSSPLMIFAGLRRTWQRFHKPLIAGAYFVSCACDSPLGRPPVASLGRIVHCAACSWERCWTGCDKRRDASPRSRTTHVKLR